MSATSDRVLARRQRQNNELAAQHRRELADLAARHREARASLEALQASEVRIVQVRHERDRVDLLIAQGVELGPWARSVLERKGVRHGTPR